MGAVVSDIICVMALREARATVTAWSEGTPTTHCLGQPDGPFYVVAYLDQIDALEVGDVKIYNDDPHPSELLGAPGRPVGAIAIYGSGGSLVMLTTDDQRFAWVSGEDPTLSSSFGPPPWWHRP